jgi:hypothetical protein
MLAKRAKAASYTRSIHVPSLFGRVRIQRPDSGNSLRIRLYSWRCVCSIRREMGRQVVGLIVILGLASETVSNTKASTTVDGNSCAWYSVAHMLYLL